MVKLIDKELQAHLESLQAAQAPICLGGPRHPTRKNNYFMALAKAFEAGRLVAVQEEACQ